MTRCNGFLNGNAYYLVCAFAKALAHFGMVGIAGGGFADEHLFLRGHQQGHKQ